jgi:hypothetical protein
MYTALLKMLYCTAIIKKIIKKIIYLLFFSYICIITKFELDMSTFAIWSIAFFNKF